MKCVYCESVMLFNATANVFVCSDGECGAKLTLTQHPDLMTKENLIKYDTRLGKERPDNMNGFNHQGISTQWYRGNK